MDIYKEDVLQFLDFSDVDEQEKIKVLSSLHCSDPNLKLPWIITENVPSRHSKGKHRKNDINQKQPSSSPNHTTFTEPLNQTPNTYAPQQHYDQSQYHNMYPASAKYPLPPPFTVGYTTLYNMPPMYAEFDPHTLRIKPTTLVSQVMYPSESAYSYPPARNVPLNNATQFPTSIAHYPSNLPMQDGVTSANSPPTNPEIINTIPRGYYEPNSVIPQRAVPNDNQYYSSGMQQCPVVSDQYVSGDIAETTTNGNINVQANPCHNMNSVPLPQNASYGVPTNAPFPSHAKTLEPVTHIPVDNTKASPEKVEQTDSTVSQNEPVAQLDKSWASLFRGSKTSSDSQEHGIKNLNSSLNQAANDKENNNLGCPIKNPRKSQFADPTCYRMGEYLLDHIVDGKTISLQPRGLINRSNYCYINSILQALLACPPLYNLMSGLGKNITSNEKRKPTPVIDNVCKLMNEFEHLPADKRVGRRTDKTQKKDQGVAINCDTPFEPAFIYKMLNGMRSDFFLIEGRQEDAEEFFGCLLNGLNDEMQELIKLVTNDDSVDKAPEVDTEWQVMGPKNKGSITRKTTFGKTPISNIFGGLLSSKIHRAGDESTNNIQPFFTLQLNIEKVKSVNEALVALVSKNQLEGVTSSKTNEEVEAWQQVTIEELPVVLVLHLKCFDYKLDGCTKIMKALEFPIDLKIDPKLLSSKISSSKEKQYKLFAVVYHDGKEASKGHYLTDAFHVGYNSWLRYDDSCVKAIPEEHVLSPQGFRVPYLLFYRRSDTIRNK